MGFLHYFRAFKLRERALVRALKMVRAVNIIKWGERGIKGWVFCFTKTNESGLGRVFCSRAPEVDQ